MNKFVVIFFLAFVGVAVASPPMNDDDRACAEEFNVSAEAVFNYNEKLEFDETSRDFKCFIKCSMVKDNLINEAGDFDQARFVRLVAAEKDPEDVLTDEQKVAILSVCDNIDVTGDACEKASAAAICLREVFRAFTELLAELEATTAASSTPSVYARLG